MGTELPGAGGYLVGDADRNRTADLPPEWRAAQQRARQPAGPPARRGPALPPEAAWLVPLLVVVAVLVVLALVTRGFLFFPWPLLWIFLAFGRRGRAGWRPPRW